MTPSFIDHKSLAIQITNVSKLFFKQEQKTLKEFLPAFFGGHKTREWFYALSQVNLTVSKGEAVGIMGPNGSGKSTLLKLLAGVTQATSGDVTTTGRVAPMIELGAGFHPELTGRENIYLNGVILGLTRRELEGLFDEIVAFASLAEFIDVPVKHYSSGMYLRLAFAVAVHTRPDILLVDEILAVGDASFQKKCLAFIRRFVRDGGTLVLVSHSREQVDSVCSRVVHLKAGKIV